MLLLFRKTLYAFTYVVFRDIETLQLLIVIFSSLGLCCYMLHYRPFRRGLLRNIEMFNELCVLAIQVMLLQFTQNNMTEKIRYFLGWVLIGISILNFFVNSLVVICFTIKGVYLWIKKRCNRRKKPV